MNAIRKERLRIFHCKFYESLLAVIIYFFKTVELDDTDTQHQNAVYGKSSKILLSGIIINWIAILFFALSKYQLSVRKEGFQGVICHFELIRIRGSRMPSIIIWSTSVVLSRRII